MTAEKTDTLPPLEIDQPETYGRYLLTSEAEIATYLRALEKQHAIITIYLDDGRTFFLSSIVAVDEDKGGFSLDLAHSSEIRRLAQQSKELTLTSSLDKVKIQMRIKRPQIAEHGGQPEISAPLPEALLRLQRREFFRLETRPNSPLKCTLTLQDKQASTITCTLSLLDISGGGVCLHGSSNQSEHFVPDAIIRECQLEIPGEGLIPVNLCVKKIGTPQATGSHSHLRIGCEFVDLPRPKQAQIERYITRVERERKAKNVI